MMKFDKESHLESRKTRESMLYRLKYFECDFFFLSTIPQRLTYDSFSVVLNISIYEGNSLHVASSKSQEGGFIFGTF